MPDRISNALVARAKAGNASAIGQLYEECQYDLFRYLYYRVGDTQFAEDLTSEVFLRVIKGLPAYRQNGQPFKAWVFKIAHNLTIDHYRRENARDSIPIDESLVDHKANPEADAERKIKSRELAQALQELTNDQREVIVLRFILGMHIGQVAHMLDKSETAVKAAQCRGLQALHRILEGWKVLHE